ncbi:MAG: UDP-N-acetylmuramoyl-tripeptide--D-alanyl-D-alanine ligase [Sulfurimonas sp.]|nr:UDP-N-acetylmuramoyl-tripeptide--D-alanyl-D-alanine ligase [Sulfurimonas sp.]
MELLPFITNITFVIALGWYLLTNLQWYDYRIKRVILHHHKRWWHVVYFIIPFILYYTVDTYRIYIVSGYITLLYFWHRRLDKKLVITWRVKRFLILLIFWALILNYLFVSKEISTVYCLFLPLALAYLFSGGIEKFLFVYYKYKAKKRIASIKNLTIICITGSYGKTSMKNFVAQLLSQKYKVYATPRSVNTPGGIIQDINQFLPSDTQIYICEAGARLEGDVFEIGQLLQPQIVVVGKVGPQHLEYFKTIECIKRTKLELIHSDRLENAFIHTSVTDVSYEKVTFFGDNVLNTNATLEGTEFDLRINGKLHHFHTSVLGNFQTININAAILIADKMGMNAYEIVQAVENLRSVEHRLERIDAGGKVILDDGYNGNIDGVLEGIRLCSLHNGRKVIVTPGLVESTKELNSELINVINNVFDIAIITGQLNTIQFKKELTVPEKILLTDKSKIVVKLGEVTREGDIIFFANDTPNFI